MSIIIYTRPAETNGAQFNNQRVTILQGGSVAFTYTQVRIRRSSPDDFAPFEVRRYGRHWEVRDPAGEVVCLTVYRRGAAEVIRRLKLSTGDQRPQ